MKWRTQVPEPELPLKKGRTRIRMIFCLWPAECVDGYTRWLEKIWIKEIVIEKIEYEVDSYPHEVLRWKRVAAGRNRLDIN
jgi:hypothetical protein